MEKPPELHSVTLVLFGRQVLHVYLKFMHLLMTVTMQKTINDGLNISSVSLFCVQCTVHTVAFIGYNIVYSGLCECNEHNPL